MPKTIDSTIDIVWSAYRSILSKAGSLAYTSTAITSGVLMQDTMDDTGLSEAELKARTNKSNVKHAKKALKVLEERFGAPK